MNISIISSIPKLKKLSDFIQFTSKVLIMFILVCLSLLLLSFFIYLGDIFLNTLMGRTKAPLFSTYVIVSPSMVPTIQIDDAIVIKRNDRDNYQIGDIITFMSNDANYQGKTITHRIVEKSKLSNERSLYVTKGDNNPVVDPFTVDTASIYGKVLFTIPKFGNVQSFFSKPTNYFLCLLVASFVFIIYELLRISILMIIRKGFI